MYEVVKDLGKNKKGNQIYGATTEYGKHIRLSSNFVDDMISGKLHTLVHEAGHTLGWAHPDDKSNSEQHVPLYDRANDILFPNSTNLMYNEGYRTMFKLDKNAISISGLQINIMLRNSGEGNLNINGKLHKKIKTKQQSLNDDIMRYKRGGLF